MSKFIILTEVYSDSSLHEVLLNIDRITLAKTSIKGKDTHINIATPDKDKFIFVRESLEQVKDMLNGHIVSNS